MTQACASSPAYQPLNRSQQRLWRLETIAASKSKANEVLCLHIQGEFNVEDLVAAIRSLPNSNHQYRSVLAIVDGSPVWRIDDTAGIRIEEGEVGFGPAVAGDQLPPGVRVSYEAERRYEFDLTVECPLRATLFVAAGGDCAYVLLTFHPLVMRRAQLETVFDLLGRELTQRASSSSHVAPGSRGDELRPPLDGATLAEFKSTVARARMLQSFPTDCVRSPIKSFVTRRYEFSIDAPPPSAILRLQGVTSHPERLALLVAFAVVVSRYQQQEDIYLGTAWAQTRRTEPLSALTLFDHSVLKATITATVTLVELMEVLQHRLLLANACSAVSLESLLDEAFAGPPLDFVPCCQVAFKWEDRVAHQFPFGTAQLRRCFAAEPDHSFSHSELELEVRPDSAGRFACAIEYSTALFECSTITAFARHFCTVWEAALARPDHPLADLQMLTTAEQSRMLGSNEVSLNYPRQALGELFERQASLTPDAIAVIDGGQHFSFATIARRSAHLACQLVADGIEADARVGVYLSRSVDFVVSVLGILRAGAVYVPLDTGCPWNHIRAQTVGIDLAYVLHAHDEITASGWKNIRLLRTSGLTPQVPSGRPRNETSPAYVVCTSGSTGKPKGVIGTHGGVVNRVDWSRSALGLTQDEVFCLSAKTTYVDHAGEIFQALLTGNPLAIVAHDDLVDAAAFVALLRRNRVTRLDISPSRLATLLECQTAEALISLKSIVCSGGVLTSALARRVFALLPQTRLFNMYGTTETSAAVSCYEVPHDPKSRVQGFFEARGQERITLGEMTLDRLKGRFADPGMPMRPVCVAEYLGWLDSEVLPYAVNVSSRKFVGHMTSALPDFMAGMSALVAKLNQNMVKIETSKSLTLLERQLLAMLHREFFPGVLQHDPVQDPSHVFGLVVSGGSSANITALWNARNRSLMNLGCTKAEIAECGAFELLRQRGYEGFAIVTSGLAHYSIRKAASLLGIGERNVVLLRQDARQRADIHDLQEKLELCRERRLLVIAIVGIAGATETGTIDPLDEMGRIAAGSQIHFHVDAAWGGALIFSDRHRGLLEGIQRADSITLCPHKQLYVPQGISLCLFKDSQSVHASSVQAAYQGRQGSFDAGQYTLEGSRPALFLCLHAILCVLSKRGIGALVEDGVEKTRFLADVIAAHPAFQLIGSPEINILNYRYLPRRLRHKSRHSLDENRQMSEAVTTIQERQFLQGRTFVSKTEILSEHHCEQKITVFRVVIANPLTTQQDLLETLADQLEIAATHVERATGEGRAARTPGARDGLKWFLPAPDLDAVPIGRAIGNVEVLILDAARRLLPMGVVGEIYVGGAGLSRGYTTELDTSDAFVAHPFEPGARLFRTGDLGRRLSDGNIEYRGRSERTVKMRSATALRLEWRRLDDLAGELVEDGMNS